VKQFQRLESLLKTNLPESLTLYFISLAIVFVSFIAISSGILVLLYYRVLPFIPSDTATLLSNVAANNLLLILGILFVPAAVIAWFLSHSRIVNKKLKKRLALDEQLLEMVDDSIFVHNLDGNCLYASKLNKKSGYTSEELRDISYRSLKETVYDDVIKPRIQGLINSGEASFESTCFQKSDQPVPVEVHSRVFESGDQNSVLSIVRDITERKRAEEELRESAQKILRAMNGTINSMASIAEVRDPYTAGHQQRVAKLAAAIATELDLPEEQIEGIRMAGTLHDIGKISIPSEILSKPGKLRKSEFDLIKDHSEVGFSLLQTIEFSQPVAQMVLQHHERMDGSGYPGGLPGDKIVIGARILGVSDVIESMSSHRPYRPAFSIEKSLLEIIMKKGILYDPQVVDACVRLFNDKGFTFD
jgi:PAS domain S-box-containing protein/putative nucleotidyltransferase with HDIG domain